ncbi:hypothetical protein P0D75_44085 [Paraburkholderia sediminicola]
MLEDVLSIEEAFGDLRDPRSRTPAHDLTEMLVVAIDGKTVCGSHRGQQRALHLVSAYGSGLGMALGQVRTADKSNEITAIPTLLDAPGFLPAERGLKCLLLFLIP